MTGTNAQPLNDKNASMEDVLRWLEADGPYKDMTLKDYRAQLSRCTKIYNANRLEDLSADLMAFQARFPKRAFPSDHFKTPRAYEAWRKKMVSLLKNFHGISKARSGRDRTEDEWDRLLRLSSQVIDAPSGMSSPLLISVKVLAKEARIAGREPQQLDENWLAALADEISIGQRKALASAMQKLEHLRKLSSEIDEMLPAGALLYSPKIRRANSIPIPQHMVDAAEFLVTECCRGQYDEILDEYSDGKSAGTTSVYQAAIRKYVGTAYRIGVLPEDCGSLSDAFARPVFNAVVRQWMLETDEATKISNRTSRSYIQCLIVLGNKLGVSIDFMSKALQVNRNLLEGKRDEQKMPEHVKIFCARLLRERDAEMRFKSLHLIFQRKANEFGLMDPSYTYLSERIVQYGVLACYAAIALWSVPLRIANMRTLRHLGPEPTLILPNGSRKDLMIVIPAEQTKARKTIRAPLQYGPTRALEVVDWYINNIRPSIPWSDRSHYLFPGYQGEIISSSSLRSWLYEHTREVGIPMTPHNFRHGLASLYLRDHPGDYGQAARLLCNTPEMVQKYYAWIDEEAEMR